MKLRLLIVLTLVSAFSFGCAHKPKAAASDANTATSETVPATTETPAAPPAPPLPNFAEDPRLRNDFDRAVSSARSGDSVGAIAELKAMVAREPRLDYAWTNLGVLSEQAGEIAEAAADYERALVANPDQVAAWDFLARLYCRGGRAKDLEARTRVFVEQHPASVGGRLALVQAQLALAAYGEAEKEAKKVLKADERNVRAMQLLALGYSRQGKLELSRMVLENARAIDPQNASTQHALGAVQLSLKAKPQALESFKQAATLAPTYAEALNDYGALLNESQDYDTAAQQLEVAVRVAPDLAAAHMNLGNAYRGQGQLEKAQAQYEEALKLDEGLKDVYFNLAVLFLDGEASKEDPIVRLNKAITYFKDYQSHGGNDEGVTQYLKDAQKGVDREQRKRERERKDALRKAAKQSESTTPAQSDKMSDKPSDQPSDKPSADPKSPPKGSK
jgi:Tfp pilus assembly protein PilF